MAAGCLALIALVTTLGLLSPAASSQAQFADPAFQSVWERTDGPVASGAASRGWVWGPVPGKSLSEPFAGLDGKGHLVQYFDKGRMEINNPNGDKNDPFYVTNGLLGVELVSGLLQTGVSNYENRRPAAINLASDPDDPSAPTYQSFNGVSNVPNAPNERRRANQTGQTVRTAIDRQGITQPWPQDHPDYGVRIAYYEPATGHNIPDVFWEYLNQQADMIQNGQLVRGPLFYPWFAQTGYPISEPYWSYVKVDGRYTDVLIQAFERRVLTYVPHLPSPFKVQMGNIGQHYYEWRYLNPNPPAPQPGPATPTAPVLPARSNVSIDAIAYRKSITDLNGNYAAITNHEQKPLSFNGWWLDSPKWDHVDRFYFPNGVTLAPNASMNVHAGPGRNTATDIYMYRTSVMWDGQPYDLAVLYDNYGREVTRFFPAAEVGQTPVPVPPSVTGTPGKGTPLPTGTPGKPLPTATGGTPKPTATGGVPSPQPTGPIPIDTSTPATAMPTGSVTATVSPTRTTTATPMRAR